MITLEEIAANRPYLKDTLKLYERTIEFRGLTSGVAGVSGAVAYTSGSIDLIFKSFSTAFEMPEDMLDPLREAMKLGQIDLTRLPLNEVPAFSLPYHKDELSAILFLLAKPYFLWLRGSANVHDAFWEEGRCPVCRSVPSLSFITQEGRRTLYCSYCESVGKWHRIGCPYCRKRDSEILEIFTAEEEKGFRVDLCNGCRSYVKTINDPLLQDYSPDLLDIISLPLDVLAQERRYERLSPNPVGMRKMA